MSAGAAMPRLVVIVLTKNRRRLLERALESIREQEHEEYRVVVVNDGSTDDTQEYLDSLSDPRIQIIRHETSRGMNAARNAALRTLTPGEWGAMLDDDDYFLPGAIETMVRALRTMPPSYGVACFNAVSNEGGKESASGFQFRDGEEWYDPTYFDVVTNARSRGDNRAVWKWTLFPKYLYREDINGFETEWWMLVARDAVGIRYFPQQTTWIDRAPEFEHLSSVIIKREPRSFARAYIRIFKQNRAFWSTHPNLLRPQAIIAMKIAIRAFAPLAFLCFLVTYVRSFLNGSSTQRTEQETYRNEHVKQI